MPTEKCDPNREIFQMRAQEKRIENCRHQWHERWSWLIDERAKELEEKRAILAQGAEALPGGKTRRAGSGGRDLKPVPVTTSGFYGWLANKKVCALEVYTPWMLRLPTRLPDAWDIPGYGESSTDSAR